MLARCFEVVRVWRSQVNASMRAAVKVVKVVKVLQRYPGSPMMLSLVMLSNECTSDRSKAGRFSDSGVIRTYADVYSGRVIQTRSIAAVGC